VVSLADFFAWPRERRISGAQALAALEAEQL